MKSRGDFSIDPAGVVQLRQFAAAAFASRRGIFPLKESVQTGSVELLPVAQFRRRCRMVLEHRRFDLDSPEIRTKRFFPIKI